MTLVKSLHSGDPDVIQKRRLYIQGASLPSVFWVKAVKSL